MIGRRAVVHYVTAGRDAPPPADGDGNGVPDYVDLVARSADAALAYFAAPVFGGRALQGFDAAVCDEAGPNELPDVYIKDLGATFGEAVPTTGGAGGSFVLVSPRLESPRRGGGAAFTTAHELFHLVQFRYVPRGMPRWVAEGTANAMAYLFEREDDISLLARTDRWFRAPWLPLSDESINCDRCYGGVLWWGVLTLRGYTQSYFDVLADYVRAGRPIGTGIVPLEQAFASAYEAAGIAGFAPRALYREF